jgi:UDP-2,3-diacylglucosamine pyrophosphatase LpxH
MPLLRIASDWHLAPASPARHGRLAADFLRRAREDGAEVILNGDVFEALFAGPGCGERAHPEVVEALRALEQAGRLRRTRGNHDPGGGAEKVALDWPGLGRVLVAHGHAADPVSQSLAGRLGDGISRRFGRLAVVRGAAWLAEEAARAVAGRRMVEIFRARCLRLVAAEGCALGVFGHVHVPHLAAGDAYANAGALDAAGLHYLELDAAGPRLCLLDEEGVECLAPGRGSASNA